MKTLIRGRGRLDCGTARADARVGWLGGLAAAAVLFWAQGAFALSGVQVSANAGAGNFARDFSSNTGAGAAYGATVAVQPYDLIGVELAYDGLTAGNNSPLAVDSRFVANGVKGALKLNLAPGAIEPYLLGGAGYYRLGSTGTAPGFGTANAFAVPLAAGVNAHISDTWLIGARFTYDLMFHTQDLRPGNPTNADLYTAMIHLGAIIR